MCGLVFGYFPQELSPLSFPQSKQINNNLKTECQQGKYHSDYLKIDSCKQRENSLCNEQYLISLAIGKETAQHITIFLSILLHLMKTLGEIVVSLLLVEI